ncbi:MAG: type II toxin-antitoxin system Phd/YefM family antitoxin [Thermoanaerobaculia bacterium]
MNKTIAISELEGRLRTVLDSVIEEHVPYVLTRGSHPEAALVPYDEYLRLQQLQEKEKDILERFDRAQELMARLNADFSEEEVARDVAKARRERSR